MPIQSENYGGRALADLRPGECGTIIRILGAAQGRLRLLEMGMTPGTHVKVLRAAAFGGPLELLVRGYQLSLRREEAACVWLGFEDRD
jgi:Fe2+ transport system protein FeoA